MESVSIPNEIVMRIILFLALAYGVEKRMIHEELIIWTRNIRKQFEKDQRDDIKLRWTHQACFMDKPRDDAFIKTIETTPGIARYCSPGTYIQRRGYIYFSSNDNERHTYPTWCLRFES